MKVKEESKKVGLKLNIQKMKIMASGPTTSWQVDGETIETVAVFILGGIFSNTTVQKHQFFSAQLSSQSNSLIYTWPREKP